MPYTTLSPEARREIVLRALSGERRSSLAREHGVSESYVYRLISEATSDPTARLAEAEAELEFRRRVLGLLRDT